MNADTLTPLPRARELVLATIEPLPAESVPLLQSFGRHLASDATSPWALPVNDHSAMDGYACRHADLGGEPLRLVGRSEPGAPHVGTVGVGEAIRILTGAVPPAGTDTVVRQEDTTVRGTSLSVATVPSPGENIRRHGEDAPAGTRILIAGQRIGPPQVAALAAMGADPVSVRKQARVAIITCGNELVPAAHAGPDTVVDSAGPMLAAICHELGAIADPGPPVPDDPDALAAAVRAAHRRNADMIITVGGASVGDRDHVRDVLRDLGCEIAVPNLQLKPGKPGGFGRLGATPVFILPGNPNAAFTVFHLLVAPALRALHGADPLPPTVPAKLTHAVSWSGSRLLVQRGIARIESDGLHVSIPPRIQGSNRVASVAQTNALVFVPPRSGDLAAGTTLQVILPRPEEA